MKKVLVVLVLCLSLLSGIGSAQTTVCPNNSYDETSVYVFDNIDTTNYKEFAFSVLENNNGENNIYQIYWDSDTDYIAYRWKSADGGEWSDWVPRNVYSNCFTQCLVFKYVWHDVKGYPFT